jgi:hypothetical protein
MADVFLFHNVLLPGGNRLTAQAVLIQVRYVVCREEFSHLLPLDVPHFPIQLAFPAIVIQLMDKLKLMEIFMIVLASLVVKE